jgi:CRP-like cAMP-binding protein
MVSTTESRRGAPQEAPEVRIQRALTLSSFFEQASRETRDRLFEAASIEGVRAGGLLVMQGGAVSSLLVLARGRARVARQTAAGRHLLLGYRGAGDLLDEAVVLGATKHAETVVAVEDGELVRIPIATVRALVETDPALGHAALALLLARQREVEDRIESVMFRSVEGRLVEFLLKAAERWGVATPQGTMIAASITHQEIAQTIGSTRETVTLALGALRRDGVLDAAGRRLIVKDREALLRRR